MFPASFSYLRCDFLSGLSIAEAMEKVKGYMVIFLIKIPPKINNFAHFIMSG
jgi:hypothetical protein